MPEGAAVGLVDALGQRFSGRVRGRVVDHLVLGRGELSQASLASATVVGPFDPGDDRQAELVAGVPRSRFRTFFCSRAKKDSMAALSPPAPTRPVKGDVADEPLMHIRSG
jgi:hypothetical protein